MTNYVFRLWYDADPQPLPINFETEAGALEFYRLDRNRKRGVGLYKEFSERLGQFELVRSYKSRRDAAMA